MREIRQSGSEGGARFYPSFLPLSGAVGRAALPRRPVIEMLAAQPILLAFLEPLCGFEPTHDAVFVHGLSG
jgi:hypothetical protein